MQRNISREITSHLDALGTNVLVQVKAVHPGTGFAGTVDVQPIVHQQTSDGAPVPHGIMYTLPYLRVQGGACAFIVDPVPGDLGYAIISGRDQSNAVTNRAPSPPGSFRTHSMADAVYVGGFLNDAPTQYVRVSGGGIALNAPDVQASANLGVTNGATGSFTTPMGQTVTVRSGIITNIC